MKYLYLLAFIIIHHVPPTHAGFTAGPRAKHFTFERTLKSEGLRYCDIDDEFLKTLPEVKQCFHKEIHRKVTKELTTYASIYSIDEKIALKQYLLAADCLLQKNDARAVELLKDAAVHLDMARILLAYCYRFGIGIGKNETAAKVLLDLGVDKEDRVLLDRVLYQFYLEIHLGL